ncbi:MAG TPA: RagB/SusD family nutrient uptake outer membrane protein [Pelobium sp.]|nr:RagB/SusD family nutrient uptake outer membrane protein [Pelobium sp.]
MKTIYKKYIIGLFISLAAMQYSCNKALDLDPLDKIGDGNFWKTPSDFKLFANQFYSWERDFSSSVYDAPHSDRRSDLITSTNANVFANGTNTIPATDGTYSGTFSKIRLINTLLAKAQGYGKPEEIAQYVAEAKFFRAYVYFDLLQLFGDAPIVDKLLDVNDPQLYGPRNDRGEVADFIIADLQAAIPDLPLQSKVTEAGRLTKGAAQAFLSRVALFEGTWQEFRNNTQRGKDLLGIAAEAAKDVITSNEYALFKPASLGDSAQKYLFILEDTKSNPAGLKKSDNKEYIFSNRHDEVIKPIGVNITQETFANVQWVARKFANLYLSSNGLPIDNPNNTQFQGYSTMNSEFQNRDNRMRYTLMPANKAYWRNTSPRVTWLNDAADLASAAFTSFQPTYGSGYHNQKWAAERAVPDRSEGYDYPIIRYAEVLLNYAEAIYERDGAISDADLDISLNLVRRRINTNMPKLSNAFVTANGLNMQTEIRRERTIELFNEGFRIDDLKRWKTAEVEMPKDVLGIKWTGTEFQTKWSNVTKPKNSDGVLIMETGRVWNDRNYLYPLPLDQLTLNPKLGQNPNWGN